MRYSLHGKTVLITGGGHGLGQIMALGAADRGATVVIWDTDTESAAATVEKITSRGGAASAMEVDVGDRAAVKRAALACGQVDVLINNAAVISGRPLLEASEEEIEDTFNVNTLALYWVTRAFLQGMISRGHGTVVTIASTAGLVGIPGQTDYGASKFAAIGFAEALRAELAKGNTGVNSLTVCPSYIDTRMFNGVQNRFPRLLPTLKAEKVAAKVLRGIERGQAQLVMPPLARTIPVARALHVRHFDRLMAFFGTSTAMDTFQGRGSTARPTPEDQAPPGSPAPEERTQPTSSEPPSAA